MFTFHIDFHSVHLLFHFWLVYIIFLPLIFRLLFLLFTASHFHFHSSLPSRIIFTKNHYSHCIFFVCMYVCVRACMCVCVCVCVCVCRCRCKSSLFGSVCLCLPPSLCWSVSLSSVTVSIYASFFLLSLSLSLSRCRSRSLSLSLSLSISPSSSSTLKLQSHPPQASHNLLSVTCFCITKPSFHLSYHFLPPWDAKQSLIPTQVHLSLPVNGSVFFFHFSILHYNFVSLFSSWTTFS